jgi:NADH-quinone oxidoreductase subunit E
VATFYFMFQLQPVGSVAHIQVCGTTSCMICGAEDLMAVCREEIAARPHELSADGKLSWEEVECLGACANAPMAQIGKDYYEDLTAEGFRQILRDLAAGKVPTPGPQNGRFTSEPKPGLTSLKDMAGGHEHNASVALALELGDTVKRIDGTEVPLLTPWLKNRDEVPSAEGEKALAASKRRAEGPTEGHPEAEAAVTGVEGDKGHPEATAGSAKAGAGGTDGELERRKAVAADRSASGGDAEDARKSAGSDSGAGGAAAGKAAADDDDGLDAAVAAIGEDEALRPAGLDAPREGRGDDLKQIKGIGPKLEEMLHGMGVYHLDQIAAWSPAELAWVDRNLEGFKGRAVRDRWVAQARALSSGGQTGGS